MHATFPSRRALIALAALAGLCLLALGSEPALQAQAGPLTGTLTVVRGVSASEPARQAPPRFLLTDDQGKVIDVVIGAAAIERAGGLRAIEGKRVVVTPAAGASAAGPRQALEVRPVGGPSVATLDPGETPVVLDNKKFISILCQFPDSGPDHRPPTLTSIQQLMGTSQSGMNHFWQEQSYGLMNLNGSVVRDWRPMPRPYADYFFSDGSAGFAALLTDCAETADAEVDFRQYYGISLFFDRDLNIGGYGANAEISLDNQRRTWAVTWLGGPVSNAERLMATLMGYAFNLPRSQGYSIDDSQWDLMGAGGGSCSSFDQNRPRGCPGVHTHTAHKDILGWITFPRKFKPTGAGTYSVTLARLAQPTTNDLLMVKIPIRGSTTQFYTAEFRRHGYGYDYYIPDSGVVITKVDTTLADGNVRVIDGDNDGDINDVGAVWKAGETFNDATNGISVRVDSMNFETARVTITLAASITINDVRVTEPAPAPPPSPFDPEPEPSPPQLSQARFTVRLANPSNVPVTVNYVTAPGTAKENIDYQRAQGKVTIPAGATTATITVNVLGDKLTSEVDETFFVNLSGPTGGILMDSQGKGTIADFG
jgi:hypothetical protein